MTTTITNTTLVVPDGFITNDSISSTAAIDVAKLAQQTVQEFPVGFSTFRVWDAITSLPPASSSSDDLGIVTGTPGTDGPTITTGDVKAAGVTTRKIGFEIPVPHNYDDGQTIEVRVRAAMETTVADVAAYVDLSAYIVNGSGLVGSDLVTTSQIAMNSLTPADCDFVLSAGSIDPGDHIMCVLSLSVEDSATATDVIAAVYSVVLRCDTRG